MYPLYRVLSTILTFPFRAPRIGGASRPSVWFHLSSLGEISSAKGLMDLFIESQYFVFVTVFTEAGYHKLKEIYKAQKNFEVVRFPYDKPSFIENVFKAKRIRALIIIETELWPNLIHIGQRHAKLYLVNARISDKNYKRIVKFKKFFSELLNSFSIIFPQSTRQKKRLLEFVEDEKKLVYLGNTKVDNLQIDPGLLLSRRDIGIPEDEFVVVFGSVRGKELVEIVDIIGPLMEKGIGVIIAPRHPTRVKLLENLLNLRGIPYTKRTKSKYRRNKVFIVDTLGELKKFYYLGNVCFVGGTLKDYGGHNVLEPAIFAKPVIFGPYTKNVEDEASGLLRYDGGIKVEGKDELLETIVDLYQNREKAALIGENALRFVESLKKVSQKIYKLILEDLGERTGSLF